MRVLELFSGAVCVGSVCKTIGLQVVSLDTDMPADIRSHIMDCDYTAYNPKDFDEYGPRLLAPSTVWLTQLALITSNKPVGYRNGP